MVALYEIFVWMYDAAQPGFAEVQNGHWEEQINFRYVYPILDPLINLHILVYFAFAVQAYWLYRDRIREYFSNTYRVALRWLRNFLLAFVGLFLFQLILGLIDDGITELHWTQRWWGHLAGALVMLYAGIMGYFTDLSKLYDLHFAARADQVEKEAADRSRPSLELDAWKETILDYLQREKPYLDPDLTLSGLAGHLKTNTSQLSQVINLGFNQNFNDFINRYRVEEVKQRLQAGQAAHLTLLAIAQDCGFNSKATFNRTFKKFTGKTPTEFLQSRKAKV